MLGARKFNETFRSIVMAFRQDAALIVIDQQKGIHHPKLGRRNNPQAEERIQALLRHWRSTGRPVIHVQHLSHLPDSVFWPGQSGVEFQDNCVPAPGEQLIQKRVPDAFSGTPLQAQLRAAGIVQLVLVGVATHNSVEATARTGGNLGFDTWVIEDACYTFDKPDFFGAPHPAELVHAMSLGNLHGEYATVINSRDVLG
jgi:nicotinamidase-related amidase